MLVAMGAAANSTGAAWLPSLRKGRADWEQMLESLSALYVRGVEVDWRGFDPAGRPPQGGPANVSLPAGAALDS